MYGHVPNLRTFYASGEAADPASPLELGEKRSWAFVTDEMAEVVAGIRPPMLLEIGDGEGDIQMTYVLSI